MLTGPALVTGSGYSPVAPFCKSAMTFSHAAAVSASSASGGSSTLRAILATAPRSTSSNWASVTNLWSLADSRAEHAPAASPIAMPAPAPMPVRYLTTTMVSRTTPSLLGMRTMLAHYVFYKRY
jgi:hypothetical protein